jgi:hypothetical protein
MFQGLRRLMEPMKNIWLRGAIGGLAMGIIGRCSR